MTSVESNDIVSPNDWKPLEPGELANFASQESTRARRRNALKWTASSAAVVVFAALASVWLATNESSMPGAYGGIACESVLENAIAYIEGGVSSSMRQKIDAHIAQCSSCGARIKLMKDEKVTVSSTVPAVLRIRHTAQSNRPKPLNQPIARRLDAGS